MSITSRLNMPLIAAAQSQKHVTHNEALMTLDAVVHLSVESRGMASPPSDPVAGARYLVPASPSGAWTGHAGAIAAEDGGGWIYLQPQSGWSAYVRDEAQLIVFNGTVWSPILVNTAAAAGFGRLTVGPNANPSSLFEVARNQDAATEARISNNNTSANASARCVVAVGRPNAHVTMAVADGSGAPYGQFAGGSGLTQGCYYDMVSHHFRDTAYTENLTITSSGSVGIGINAPAAKLHVKGGSIRVEDTGGFPIQTWFASSAPTDEKFWEWAGDKYAKTFALRALKDDLSAANYALVITRSGYAINGVYFGGNVAPTSDNVFAFGTSGLRWGVIYAATGTINTSDAREKTTVRPLDDRELAAARDLRNEIGAFQFLDAVAKKGADKARLHVGMTVQRAIEIMESHDLDPWRYAMFCRDDVTTKRKTKRIETVQKHRTIEKEYLDVQMRDGQPVQVRTMRAVKEPVFELRAIVDEQGQPVVEMRPSLDESGKMLVSDDGAPVLDAVPLRHPVPVLEEIEIEVEIEEAAGDRLGFRTDQLMLFMLRGLA